MLVFPARVAFCRFCNDDDDLDDDDLEDWVFVVVLVDRCCAAFSLFRGARPALDDLALRWWRGPAPAVVVGLFRVVRIARRQAECIRTAPTVDSIIILLVDKCIICLSFGTQSSRQ